MLGDNHIKTRLKSTPDLWRATQKKRRLLGPPSRLLPLSHGLSITLTQQPSPALKPLSGCRARTHKFHHGNIWNKGGWAGCRDRPGVSPAAIKTNQNKSSLTALASTTHMHGVSANLINVNCFSAALTGRRRMTSLLASKGDAEPSRSHITGFHFGSCKTAFKRDGSADLPAPTSLGRIPNPAAPGQHMPAPTPCTSRAKICKVPQSSKQKLQRKIGQMSELKCIPGDMSSSLSLWPSSSHLPHPSCLSLHFSSSCISWPDAGPSDDNMDPHLPLFRIGELKTLDVEILSSDSNSLAP